MEFDKDLNLFYRDVPTVGRQYFTSDEVPPGTAADELVLVDPVPGSAGEFASDAATVAARVENRDPSEHTSEVTDATPASSAGASQDKDKDKDKAKLDDDMRAGATGNTTTTGDKIPPVASKSDQDAKTGTK